MGPDDVLKLTDVENDGRFARFELMGWWDHERLASGRATAHRCLSHLRKELSSTVISHRP